MRRPSPFQPQDAASLRGLKLLVGGLGALVVLGTALVIGVIVQRLYARPAAKSTVVAPPPGAGPLHLPAGSRIAGIAGAGGAIAVWVQDAAGGRVLLLDPATGAARDAVEAPAR